MFLAEDCIALCRLTEQEVMAIAQHEHVLDIVAAAMARYLLKEPNGPEKIGDMIRDDIRDAWNRGDKGAFYGVRQIPGYSPGGEEQTRVR